MATQLNLNLPPTSAGARKLFEIRLVPSDPASSFKRAAISLRAARQRINLAIANEIARMTRENFGASGQYRPAPWPPYSKRYAKKHPGSPTLVRSGSLQSSIRASATNSKGIVTVEGSRNYAAAQQFGYRFRNLPPRPYFPVYNRGATVELTFDAWRNVQRVFEAEVKRVLDIR